MSKARILKAGRPNALKIAIIILVLYSESYHGQRGLGKTQLYRVLKMHYHVENSKNIKNQVEMLKASKIIKEEGDALLPLVSPELSFRIYGIIQEAPDDIFPIFGREIDFFRYMAKSVSLSPMEVFRDVVNALHSDIRTEYMKKLNPIPRDVELRYDKESLFSFLFNEFSVFTETLGPVSLEWFALRYLARLIFEDLKTGSALTWKVKEIHDIKEHIQNKLPQWYEYEDIFNLLKAASSPELSEKIALTCFPPLNGGGGQ
ncbi:MAG: hypothetical protein QXU18_12065, partial [Thermoplasmatales archaeon]